MENKLECRPVLLATNEVTSIYTIMGYLFADRLYGEYDRKHQHLYLVSSREIKEGDWVYKQGSGTLLGGAECISYGIYNGDIVIASTDSSLGLPGISQSFITEYVAKEGKIDKVYLQLSERFNRPAIDTNMGQVIILPTVGDENVNAFDYIEASKKHYSKTYTREEVIDILKDFYGLIENDPFTTHDERAWFDLNYPQTK